VNHWALAVGYGTVVGTPFEYFKVKNSFGTTWGEQVCACVYVLAWMCVCVRVCMCLLGCACVCVRVCVCVWCMCLLGRVCL
jgi:hypothetical protein